MLWTSLIPLSSTPIQEKQRNLKYAVVNLYNGVELLLKTRLMKEDWELVFENLNKVTWNYLRAGISDQSD